jgi:hypothetical protein
MVNEMIDLNKPIAIIGCPRSGTGYAAKSFQIGHEKWTKKGIASWCLVDKDPLYGPSLEEILYMHPNVQIFHQTRNPIDTISSLMTMSLRTFRKFSKTLNFSLHDSKLKNSMRIWLLWNALAEEFTNDQYQVEKFAETFPDVVPHENKQHNKREHPTVTYDQLWREDSLLLEFIDLTAKKYGYKL